MKPNILLYYISAQSNNLKNSPTLQNSEKKIKTCSKTCSQYIQNQGKIVTFGFLLSKLKKKLILIFIR